MNDSSVTGNDGVFPGKYVTGKRGKAFDLSTGKLRAADNEAYDFNDESITSLFVLLKTV